MITWSFTRFLQRAKRMSSRERRVSAWIVVPTRTATNRNRIGVTARAFTSRAWVVTGVMSP
jgi:hypothetical protein